jgi:plasmid stabilization system protein ParE
MARGIVWTETALDDLEASAGYISKDSPVYAAVFVREVRDAARSLTQMAGRGRVVPEFGDPSLRELLVRNHRLIYRVSKQEAYVLALIHGARDLSALRETGGRF